MAKPTRPVPTPSRQPRVGQDALLLKLVGQFQSLHDKAIGAGNLSVAATCLGRIADLIGVRAEDAPIRMSNSVNDALDGLTDEDWELLEATLKEARGDQAPARKPDPATESLAARVLALLGDEP